MLSGEPAFAADVRKECSPTLENYHLRRSALSYSVEMKDARGLAVTADDANAVAAADDFATRLLRLDQGVESILEAVKRWPQTPILQLDAAAFWLYGQTGDARA